MLGNRYVGSVLNDITCPQQRTSNITPLCEPFEFLKLHLNTFPSKHISTMSNSLDQLKATGTVSHQPGLTGDIFPDWLKEDMLTCETTTNRPSSVTRVTLLPSTSTSRKMRPRTLHLSSPHRRSPNTQN
jgi:hypothetical protein